METRKMRPPTKWHGGKAYLCQKIIEHFPPHSTYVEPFGGGASVLLNKPPSPVEVYNDIDHRITRLFRVLRNNGHELRKRLQLTPYSEAEFMACLEDCIIDADSRADNDELGWRDDIEDARRDFVRWRMSIGGRGDAFSYTKHRIRRGMADVVSGYLSAIDEELPKIIDRLSTVQIMCRPAIEVIRLFDSPDTCFYIDPPYAHAARASPEVYNHEMDDDAHTELAEVLHGCSGKVILSGYRCELYDKLYADWRSVSFDIANHSASGKQKQRREEVIWMNW